MATLVGVLLVCLIVYFAESTRFESFIDLSNDIVPYNPPINIRQYHEKRSNVNERLNKWETIRIKPFIMEPDGNEYSASRKTYETWVEYIKVNVDWVIKELEKILLVQPLKSPIHLQRVCSNKDTPPLPGERYHVTRCNKKTGRCQQKPSCDNIFVFEDHANECEYDNVKQYSAGNRVIDSDLVLYIRIISAEICGKDSNGSRILAQAGPCQKTNVKGAPEAGIVEICDTYLQDTSKYKTEHFRVTLLHEIFHVLLYSLDNTNCSSKLTSVVEFARNYFNCQALKSVKLNNCGDNGHYDERLFPDGLMSPQHSSLNLISELDLAFLKESGWYRIKDSYVPFKLNQTKGKGCEFVNQKKKFRF